MKLPIFQLVIISKKEIRIMNMESSHMRELSLSELNEVQGGSNFESLGYRAGRAAGWFYNNILIGVPW